MNNQLDIQYMYILIAPLCFSAPHVLLLDLCFSWGFSFGYLDSWLARKLNKHSLLQITPVCLDDLYVGPPASQPWQHVKAVFTQRYCDETQHLLYVNVHTAYTTYYSIIPPPPPATAHHHYVEIYNRKPVKLPPSFSVHVAVQRAQNAI